MLSVEEALIDQAEQLGSFKSVLDKFKHGFDKKEKQRLESFFCKASQNKRNELKENKKIDKRIKRHEKQLTEREKLQSDLQRQYYELASLCKESQYQRLKYESEYNAILTKLNTIKNARAEWNDIFSNLSATLKSNQQFQQRVFVKLINALNKIDGINCSYDKKQGKGSHSTMKINNFNVTVSRHATNKDIMKSIERHISNIFETKILPLETEYTHLKTESDKQLEKQNIEKMKVKSNEKELNQQFERIIEIYNNKMTQSQKEIEKSKQQFKIYFNKIDTMANKIINLSMNKWRKRVTSDENIVNLGKFLHITMRWHHIAQSLEYFNQILKLDVEKSGNYTHDVALFTEDQKSQRRVLKQCNQFMMSLGRKMDQLNPYFVKWCNKHNNGNKNVEKLSHYQPIKLPRFFGLYGQFTFNIKGGKIDNQLCPYLCYYDQFVANNDTNYNNDSNNNSKNNCNNNNNGHKNKIKKKSKHKNKNKNRGKNKKNKNNNNSKNTVNNSNNNNEKKDSRVLQWMKHQFKNENYYYSKLKLFGFDYLMVGFECMLFYSDYLSYVTALSIVGLPITLQNILKANEIAFELYDMSIDSLPNTLLIDLIALIAIAYIKDKKIFQLKFDRQKEEKLLKQMCRPDKSKHEQFETIDDMMNAFWKEMLFLTLWDCCPFYRQSLTHKQLINNVFNYFIGKRTDYFQATMQFMQLLQIHFGDSKILF